MFSLGRACSRNMRVSRRHGHNRYLHKMFHGVFHGLFHKVFHNLCRKPQYLLCSPHNTPRSSYTRHIPSNLRILPSRCIPRSRRIRRNPPIPHTPAQQSAPQPLAHPYYAQPVGYAPQPYSAAPQPFVQTAPAMPVTMPNAMPATMPAAMPVVMPIDPRRVWRTWRRKVVNRVMGLTLA